MDHSDSKKTPKSPASPRATPVQTPKVQERQRQRAFDKYQKFHDKRDPK